MLFAQVLLEKRETVLTEELKKQAKENPGGDPKLGARFPIFDFCDELEYAKAHALEFK